MIICKPHGFPMVNALGCELCNNDHPRTTGGRMIHQYNNATDWPNAPWVYVSDLTAHMLKLKEVVEGGGAHVVLQVSVSRRERRFLHMQARRSPAADWGGVVSGYITNLAVILREAQGVTNAETGKDIDIGGEVLSIRRECDAFRVRIARLEALLGEAPHRPGCESMQVVDRGRYGVPIFGECTCFKARV